MIRIRMTTLQGEINRTFRGATLVVGRSKKCELSLPNAKGMSRFHCRLTVSDGSCFLEDLGSRNGVKLNGRPVTRAEVNEGDVVTAATAVFRIASIREDEPTEEMVHPCLHCGHLFSAKRDVCPRCETAVQTRGRSRTIGASTFPGYRLIRKLGSGGMGIVFEANDLENDRDVALKVLRPHLARNPHYLLRFIEEIRLLTSISDPAIVQVYGRGREEDLHYITMELVRGVSVREAMRERGFLPWEQAARVAWCAAKALNSAYRQAGVVHGDVKPGNFLFKSNGSVKLCDFGLAQVDLKGSSKSNRAAEEERRGTAAYAAPERFRDGGRPRIASDMYSLGVSIFHMATGQLPFKGASVSSLRIAHDEQPVPRMETMRPGVNPGLQLLVERLMSKQPKRRYADYPSLISDLSLLVN